MTPNERIKNKQDDAILHLALLQEKLERLEELASFLGVGLFLAQDKEVRAKSINIAVKLELLSKVWDVQKMKYVGPDNEVTG